MSNPFGPSSDAHHQLRYGGSCTEMEIPLTHPWFDFLNRHRHEIMDNGGLAPHGILEMTLGGITQRFDLTQVTEINYRGGGESIVRVRWRMCGEPTDG